MARRGAASNSSNSYLQTFRYDHCVPATAFINTRPKRRAAASAFLPLGCSCFFSLSLFLSFFSPILRRRVIQQRQLSELTSLLFHSTLASLDRPSKAPLPPSLPPSPLFPLSSFRPKIRHPVVRPPPPPPLQTTRSKSRCRAGEHRRRKKRKKKSPPTASSSTTTTPELPALKRSATS